MIECLDRVVIASKNLDETVSFFSDLLNIDFDIVGSDDVLMVRGAYSASGLEVIEPYGSDSYLEAYIKARGEGLMGLVFKVKNIDKEAKRFEEKGLVKIMELNSGDMREVGFLSDKLLGVQIILVEYPAKHQATIAAWGISGPPVENQ